MPLCVVCIPVATFVDSKNFAPLLSLWRNEMLDTRHVDINDFYEYKDKIQKWH